MDENEMDWAGSTHQNENCVQNFSRKDKLEDLGIDGREILRRCQ
jgi:hypothetical protein